MQKDEHCRQTNTRLFKPYNYGLCNPFNFKVYLIQKMLFFELILFSILQNSIYINKLLDSIMKKF